MEIIEQVPGPASILVAVGGGGLIGGIASWVRDGATVVGVESEGCPALHAAREAGGPVDVAVGGIAASALGASRLGDHAWRANEWIDQSVLVSDQDIVKAQTWLWETCRVLAEPAACAPSQPWQVRPTCPFRERGLSPSSPEPTQEVWNSSIDQGSVSGRLHQTELLATRPFDLHPSTHAGQLHDIGQELPASDLDRLDGCIQILDVAGVERLRAVITGKGHGAVDPRSITRVDKPVILILPLLDPPPEHGGEKLDSGSGIGRVELEMSGSDSQGGSSR